jgi:hypothetical protein
MVQEELYSALYRIEYEKFTNEAARQGVRTIEIYFWWWNLKENTLHTNQEKNQVLKPMI